MNGLRTHQDLETTVAEKEHVCPDVTLAHQHVALGAALRLKPPSKHAEAGLAKISEHNISLQAEPVEGKDSIDAQRV
jgi:hypothetical protein